MIDESESAAESQSINESTDAVTSAELSNNNEAAAGSPLRGNHEWISLLGIRNKPDQLSDWDDLYNLKDQNTLRKQCQELIQTLESQTTWLNTKSRVTVPALESMMTLWCKRRKIDNIGKIAWTEVMLCLIEAGFQNSQLFNVFDAVTTKYIPKDTQEGAKVYDLFHLILQYHDAEICSHLDSLKVSPYSYSATWFKTLLSADLIENNIEGLIALWQIYFRKADPFLIFFIALNLVMADRKTLMSITDREEIVAFLRDLPKKMEITDIADLIDICIVQLTCTPLSVQEDFHCMLFGANMVEEVNEIPLHTLICLPISVQELYRSAFDATTSSAFEYFIIDTRSQAEFCAGSFPASFNLSGHLLIDNPEKFNMAMSSLLKYKTESCPKDHICFFGAGIPEDDSVMFMVISRFLHQKVNHISYVEGGYKAFHAMLKDTGNLSKLDNHHNKDTCIHCRDESEGGDSFAQSLIESVNQKSKGLKDAAKNITNLFQRTDFFAKGSSTFHVSSTDRHQKRYRNSQSVFSIEDDSSSDSEEITADFSSLNEKLKWSNVVSAPETLFTFTGSEVISKTLSVPCHVALTATQFVVYHIVDNEPNVVRVDGRHPLTSVMKISCKKQYPEFLTFQFGFELRSGEQQVSRVRQFVMEKSGDLSKAIKQILCDQK